MIFKILNSKDRNIILGVWFNLRWSKELQQNWRGPYNCYTSSEARKRSSYWFGDLNASSSDRHLAQDFLHQRAEHLSCQSGQSSNAFYLRLWMSARGRWKWLRDREWVSVNVCEWIRVKEWETEKEKLCWSCWEGERDSVRDGERERQTMLEPLRRREIV